MEQTPTPIDINKLKSILNKSKAVMAATESMKPQALSEMTNQIADTPHDDYEVASVDYNADMVQKSNLPPAIKKIMMERKIPVVNSFQKFSLSDVNDEDYEKELPPPSRRPQPQPNQKRQINEQVIPAGKSDMITISKSELNNLINERLVEFMSKVYNQRLTEDTIARTIKTLISEGKISVKKKTL